MAHSPSHTSRLLLAGLPFLLTGCPFIFGEPDYGFVPIAPSDPAPVTSGVAQDSGNTPATLTPTGPGSELETALRASAHLHLEAVELSFTLTGLDGAPEEAVLEVRDGSTTATASLLDVWDPTSNLGAITVAGVEFSCGEGDIQRDYTLVVTDAAGDEWSAEATLRVPAVELGTADSVGEVVAPAMFCGETARLSRYIEFEHQPGGLWSMSLRSDARVRLALNAGPTTLGDMDHDSTDFGTEGPWELDSGETYTIEVAGGQGGEDDDDGGSFNAASFLLVLHE